jgi:hypothetical protein
MGLENMFFPAVAMGKYATVTAKYYSSWERLSADAAIQSLFLLNTIQALSPLIDSSCSRHLILAIADLISVAVRGIFRSIPRQRGFDKSSAPLR